jgi:hypothetical protein
MIPKCKSCELYQEGVALSHSKKGSVRGVTSLVRARYCDHSSFTSGNPAISSRELRTSPQWCPLRK